VEVDGVPVFWQEGPPPLAAVLMFRVGVRDESFPQRGISHLVEHLAMSGLGRRHHEFNASVHVAMTTFEATGPAVDVAAFLTDVCRALADLPTDRLETERKILAVEAEDAGGIVDLHLLLRYGLRGPGLAAARPPAPDALDADAVRSWAGRHFVRSAAVLALTGPPPPGLRLPLADGPVPNRPDVPPLDLLGPLWISHGGDRGIAMSVRIPAGEAAAVAGRVARHRLTEELRYRLGLVYDVGLEIAASASGADGTLTLVADPLARAAGQAATVFDAVLTDLRRHGPTEAELADDLTEGRVAHEDPRSALDKAASAAAEHLHHGRAWDPDVARGQRSTLSRVDVSDALSGYPDTAILTVPEGVEPYIEGFTRYPDHVGEPVHGREFKRQRFSPVPRGGTLVVGQDGVSLVLQDSTVTIRWEDVVGYGDGPDDIRTLYGGNGCTIDLHPVFFRAGEDALALVEAHVPGHLRFVESAQAPDPARDRAGRTRQH
jgi:hypothetical protein